jgi:hypothetical protein
MDEILKDLPRTLISLNLYWNEKITDNGLKYLPETL